MYRHGHKHSALCAVCVRREGGRGQKSDKKISRIPIILDLGAYSVRIIGILDIFLSGCYRNDHTNGTENIKNT